MYYFLFFVFNFINIINLKSEDIKKEDIIYNNNVNKFNNIKIINNVHKKIFNNDSYGFIINDIFIEINEYNNINTDETINKNNILKENILKSLTFSKGSFLNTKNSTISNNIRRIKKLFPFIDDISFECKLIKNNDNKLEKLDIIVKIKKYKTIKEIIIDSKKNSEIDILNNEYKDKYITKNIIDDIKDKIKKKFQDVNIIKIIDNETNSENIYNLNKKQKVFIINNIDFIGNKNINKNNLLNKITLKGVCKNSLGKNIVNEIKNTSLNDIKFNEIIPKLQKDVLYWSSLYFNKETFENDKKEIIKLYHNNGYLDAEINKIEIKKLKNKNIIDIIYHIDEGKKYFIGKIDIIGNKNIKTDILLKILNINYGDPFNFSYIQEKIHGNPMNPLAECIKNFYGSLGYLKANIDLKIDLIDNNYINIKIIINEGDIVKINKIKITGNRFTNNQFFYRYSSLFPGDNYNNFKFLATQQNIMRNEFVKPEKTLVTIDNDNNIQMIVDEKLLIEPVFNIKAQKVDQDYYCDCCKCCQIAPSITLGAKLGNLNLRKLLHIKDPKYLYLGNGDMLNFNIIYNPIDSRLDTGLEITLREITKNIGGGFGINYTSFRGAIDNEYNNFDEKKEEKKKKRLSFCENKVNKINIVTKLIYSNFSRNISVILTPFNFNTTFGKNKYKVFKCYIDFPIGLEFKISTISNNFWNINGIEFVSSIILSNPILFLLKKTQDTRYKIHKDIRILNTFSLYKKIINNLVFYLNSSFGFSKSIEDNSYNCFKIKKDDNDNFETSGVKNITYLHLKGILENSSILRAINRSNCNFAFKSNVELRYLFLTTPIVNSYIFCFFNGGNLFLGQNNKDYKYIKNLSKKNMFNPIRFYSFGVGIRIEPEIIKMIIPITFSIYFDTKNKSLSFNLLRK